MKLNVGLSKKGSAFLLPLFVIICALLFVLIRSEQGHRRASTQSQYFVTVQQLGELSSDYLHEIHSDIRYLAAELSLLSLQNNQLTSDEFDRAVNQKFALFVINKPRYSQIRILNIWGKETHRVNYKNKRVEVVTASNLQNKNDRYYFTAAQSLQVGEVYQSPLDLNIERGVITKPIEPTIRFATPIHNFDKGELSYLVINFNANQLLNLLSDRLSALHAPFYLINNRGYPILSHDPTLTWGFMYDKDELSLKSSHPSLFTQARLSTTPTVVEIASGKSFVVSPFCGSTSCQRVQQGAVADASNNVAMISDARDMPWYFIVDLDSDNVLQPWWINHWGYFFIALLVALAWLGLSITKRLTSTINDLICHQSELADANLRFDKILQTVPFGVVIVNNLGVIEELNKAIEDIFEISRIDLHGQPIEKLITGIDVYSHSQHVRDFFKCPRALNPTKDKPYVITTKVSQNQRLLDVNIDFFKLNKRTFALTLIQDVTVQTKLQDNLKQAQKMEALGTLTDGIAHDFNNLLGIISGNLQLLEMREDNDPRTLEKLNSLRKATQNASDLTQKLLGISRKKVMNLTVIDLNQFAHDAQTLLSQAIPPHIKFHFYQTTDLPSVVSDENELLNALINLVINARDAMPEGGDVFVSFDQAYLDRAYLTQHDASLEEGCYAVIAISDSGSGIPPEIIDHIFEPFFTTKAQGRGTGLGLATIYGLVKQLKGHIRVYSEANTGTTFRVYLPATSAAPLNQQLPKDFSEDISFAQRYLADKEALVVDDEKDLAVIAVAFLRKIGMRCDTAYSAEQAIAALETKSYTLLVSDIVMPGEHDGLYLYRELPHLAPATAMVLTSGFSAELIKKQYRASDNFYFVMKPYAYHDLITTCARAVKGKEKVV